MPSTEIQPADRSSWFLALSALYAGAITVASSVSSSALPGGAIWNFDKVIHLCVFAGLGLLLTKGFDRPAWGGRRLAPWIAFALAAGFGALDEWHQSFVPGRDASAADWVADAVGASLGALGTWRYWSLSPRTAVRER